MGTDRISELDERITSFLQRVVEWAKVERDLVVVALAGSYAHGNATAESDVDLLLLVRNPEAYVKNQDWVSNFGRPSRILKEDWGKVTALRVFYVDGLEVEYGIADLEWGSDPADEGDARVIRGGLIVLYEVDQHLSRSIHLFSASPEDLNSDAR